LTSYNKQEILLRQQNLGKNATIEVSYPTLKNGDPVEGHETLVEYLNH